VSKITDTPFPLLRYFLIYGGSGAFIFYLALLFSILLSERDILSQQYIANLEEKASVFYSELSRTVLKQHNATLATIHQQDRATKQEFRALVTLLLKASFRFTKVAFFNPDGITLYNHNAPSQEGGFYNSINSKGFQSALKGKSYSKLEGIGGARFMEIYLPTYGADGKKVVGVMEVYEDVSRFENMAYQALKNSIAMPTSIFFLFALMLTVLIRKADRIITKSTSLLVRIRQQMEKYISQSAIKAIYSSVTEETELFKGEMELIVVFFSDIRGFTSYSESLDPQEVVVKINQLFDLQADSITDRHGVIDKFVGDEIMATFPPSHAEEAVLAAIEVISTIHNDSSIDLEVGIGIHYGEAVVGSIGTDDRRDYTAIGNTVNTASRLCSAASARELIIGQDLYEQLSPELNKQFTQQEPLALKGKQEKLTTYSLKLESS
jgi:class 3 adenylate cyclase